jgi:hypothetical protein
MRCSRALPEIEGEGRDRKRTRCRPRYRATTAENHPNALRFQTTTSGSLGTVHNPNRDATKARHGRRATPTVAGNIWYL